MESFSLKIETCIAISIAFIKNINFLFSFLAIKDNKSDILAKFLSKIFINKTISIFASKHLKIISLSIIYNIYLKKIC